MTRTLLAAGVAAVWLTGCLGLRHPPPVAPAPAPQGDGASVIGTPGNPPFYEVMGRRYFVMPSAAGYRERGVASWYGGKFHGRNTSNGERYDMYRMTAAHKTLPLPTWVRVTNLRNGASVVVRVNDRGPFVANRVIDLSYAAAQRLDMVTEGTTLVEIEALGAAEVSVPAIHVAAARMQPAQTAAGTATAAPQTLPAAPDAGQPAPSPLTSYPLDAPPPPQPTPSRDETPGANPATAPTPADTEPPPAEAVTRAAPGDGLHSSPAATGAAVADDRPRAAGAATTVARAGAPVANAAEPIGPLQIYVQVGAFSDEANARRLRATLYNAAIHNVRLAGGDLDGVAVYRVQIGPIAGVPEYDALVARLESLGIGETHLITE